MTGLRELKIRLFKDIADEVLEGEMLMPLKRAAGREMGMGRGMVRGREFVVQLPGWGRGMTGKGGGGDADRDGDGDAVRWKIEYREVRDEPITQINVETGYTGVPRRKSWLGVVCRVLCFPVLWVL